ncbi:MAG TPA: pectinesterase family protein [Bacteroidales bacterium]|mgnify:CR=1 FL=1|nr:pectinesterase family protein [Bacteroidales bacterium]HPF02800.1 pectinesterase family protein [Bacteroidales bacterium]HPJ58884.1 pectinesterase family protein [Bacteroidales bacterium]HPR12138.1 pectinesterase family protein [Bacteroidales bacterium]HRW84822.1 pectinesterase family protein [Bacteroidales bacterium]
MKLMSASTYMTFLLFVFMLNGVSAQENYNITVAQDGSGDYRTIQEAVDASKSFPDQRVTIHVRNGVYREKIVVPAVNTHLSIIGEDAEKTVITWDDSFARMKRGRNSTFYTYTLLVIADDFYAENLTIENSAGPVGQAIALYVYGDRCVFRNCRILGNQDTLYTDGQNSRQYFEGCFITGTTDFIFGPATALFRNCTIHSKRDSFITAASTPEGKPYGYVFMNCQLTADPGVQRVFLGRPWRDHAKTAYIYCDLGQQIAPAGWSNWQGTGRDKTAYYAEYGNRGAGADISQRVSWSHHLTRDEAEKYTLKNILSPVLPFEKPVEEWVKGNE